MLENYEILQSATDQDGKPFRIIKVPLPSIIEWTAEIVEKAGDTDFDKLEANKLGPDDGRIIGEKVTRVASVSYLNFLVSNGVIINASYINYGTSLEQEAKVKSIFKEVFPGLEQVWIDALSLNRNGGGIHCITLQEPLNGKDLKIVLP
jgi:agmatine deiminase